MDKSGPGFAYLKTKFPALFDAQIKEGVFVSPQITDLTEDEYFMEELNNLENEVWSSFIKTTQSFIVIQK